VKRIFVTGGAGYIGSHVVKVLGEQGFDVLVYDNLSTGRSEAVLFGGLVVGDLGDVALLEETVEAYRPDVVIHFAASIEVEESVRAPLKYYRNNACNTLGLLSVMGRCGVDRLIFSSSAAVYGMPNQSIVSEDSPLEPVNPYGWSKAFVERMLEDQGRAGGISYVSLRYFNAAGADPEGRIGQNYPNPFHLIDRALKTAKGRYDRLRMFGTDYPTPDGTCIRDYVHVKDIASAHVLAVEYLLEGQGSDAFNIGYGHGYSVREVVNEVKRATGREFDVEEAPRRLGDPPVLVASNEKIMRVLSWRPEHDDLEFMIRTAWKWERSLDPRVIKKARVRSLDDPRTSASSEDSRDIMTRAQSGAFTLKRRPL